MGKGQASVEFSVVFAVTMVVLIFISFLVYNQISLVSIQKENGDAQSALSQMSLAARAVYTQGEGASQVISVLFPPDYEPASSGIINSSLVLRVRGTYYVENLPFPTSGNLPSSSGGHDMKFSSRGGSVFIGSELMNMSPQLTAFSMAQESAESKTITIGNPGNATISVVWSPDWDDSEVNLHSEDDLEFTLDPHTSSGITLDFTTTPGSQIGSYAGTVSFRVNDSQSSDTQAFNIYVEVT